METDEEVARCRERKGGFIRWDENVIGFCIFLTTGGSPTSKMYLTFELVDQGRA